MEQTKLKLLVENELYPLVLVYSQDELEKITFNSVRDAINQFIGKYKEQLTVENIDFLTEYIWQVINKKKNKLKIEENIYEI